MALADVALQRLWRWPDADWNAAPAAHRTGRVDPPQDRRDRFGVLYLADTVITAAFETRVLAYSKNAEGNEEFEVVEDKPHAATGAMPPPLMVATHQTLALVAFVDLESPQLKDVFGIALKGALVSFTRWRDLSLAVFEFLEKTPNPAMPLVGVTYETQQNGGNGRNYALFDCYRDMALVRGASTPLDRAQLRRDVGGAVT